MYLFYRSVRLAPGSLREQMAWATTITEKVNQIGDSPVNLWSTTFSPGSGTLAWTMFAEHLDSLEATNDKLLVDNAYLDLVEQAAKWDSGDPIEDGLLQFVLAAEPSGEPPAYSSVVRATLAPGSFTTGVAIGVEIAKRAEQASGVSVDFAIATTGAYGGVAWMAGYESIAQMEQASQKLNSDPGFAAYLDKEAKTAYLAGASTQTVYRRIV